MVRHAGWYITVALWRALFFFWWSTCDTKAFALSVRVTHRANPTQLLSLRTGVRLCVEEAKDSCVPEDALRFVFFNGEPMGSVPIDAVRTVACAVRRLPPMGERPYFDHSVVIAPYTEHIRPRCHLHIAGFFFFNRRQRACASIFLWMIVGRCVPYWSSPMILERGLHGKRWRITTGAWMH